MNISLRSYTSTTIASKPKEENEDITQGGSSYTKVPKGVPKGYWNDPRNRRLFFDRIAKELDIKRPEDWYRVKISEVHKLGGKGLLNNYYRDSLLAALRSVYPEHSWRAPVSETKIKIPRGHWERLENHKPFFDKLAAEFNIKKPEDWFAVPLTAIYMQGGQTLLRKYYGGSLIKALQTVYPETEWSEPEGTKRVHLGFWKQEGSHRDFFDKLAAQLGITKYEDWYNVTLHDVESRGGKGLLNYYYGHSLHRALAAVYPEFPWSPYRFSKVPSGLWKNPLNHHDYFVNVLAPALDIKHLDDWYSVQLEDIPEKGASMINNHYGGSLTRALMSIYPYHNWKIWKFKHLTSDTSMDASHFQSYIDELGASLRIRHLDDWYRVSLEQIARFGGLCFVNRNGGLFLILKKLYPNHGWDERRFCSVDKRSSQRWMLLNIRRIFATEEIIEEYLHPDLVFSTSQRPMEFDAFIPSLSLAFEYQGEPHYRDTSPFCEASQYQKDDMAKVEACKQAGITLVSVPYVWDGSLTSLAAMIDAVRPDLPAVQDILKPKQQQKPNQAG